MVGEQLPSITGKELCRLLEKDGWTCIRRGQHGRYYAKIIDGVRRVTQVTNKSGQLPQGTLKAILSEAQTGLGREGLRRLLSK